MVQLLVVLNLTEQKNLIRQNIFPVLYKISEIFINIREQRKFSTELLKKIYQKLQKIQNSIMFLILLM